MWFSSVQPPIAAVDTKMTVEDDGESICELMALIVSGDSVAVLEYIKNHSVTAEELNRPDKNGRVSIDVLPLLNIGCVFTQFLNNCTRIQCQSVPSINYCHTQSSTSSRPVGGCCVRKRLSRALPLWKCRLEVCEVCSSRPATAADQRQQPTSDSSGCSSPDKHKLM